MLRLFACYRAKSQFKEFCECFDIPYRTVTEWERGPRNAPDYVPRLLVYYIRMENMVKEKEDNYEVSSVF